MIDPTDRDAFDAALPEKARTTAGRLHFLIWSIIETARHWGTHDDLVSIAMVNSGVSLFMKGKTREQGLAMLRLHFKEIETGAFDPNLMADTPMQSFETN